MSRLYYIFDRWAINIADRLGVKLSYAKSLDLRGSDAHPLQTYYAAARYQSVLINVPLSKLRGLGSAAFPCVQESGHPFIKTLVDYHQGSVRSYTGSALENYYQSWCPNSAAEYLGISNYTSLTYLNRLKAVEAVMPWSRLSPEKQHDKIKNSVKVASASNHGSISYKNNRWHFFGPATAESGVQEYKRLLNVYNSIKDNGYQRSDKLDEDIRGVLLVNDNDWCVFIIGGGQHRSSVLSALGNTTAPVRLFQSEPAIVRREDYLYWPHVVDGLFTPEAALKIFDRVFAGIQPWQNCNND